MGKTIYFFQQDSAKIDVSKRGGPEENPKSFYALEDGEIKIVEEHPSQFYELMKKHYDGLAKKIILALDSQKREIEIQDITVKMNLPPGLKDYEDNEMGAGKWFAVRRGPLDQNFIADLKRIIRQSDN